MGKEQVKMGREQAWPAESRHRWQGTSRDGHYLPKGSAACTDR